MSILLVEDEPLTVMAVTEFLKDAGHEVIPASTGDIAVEHVTNRPGRISLLITGLSVPGTLNGIDVVNWTRAPYPDIPVIMTTARGHAISRSWLDRQRVTLMDKPYSLADLVKTVRKLLAKGDIGYLP